MASAKPCAIKNCAVSAPQAISIAAIKMLGAAHKMVGGLASGIVGMAANRKTAPQRNAFTMREEPYWGEPMERVPIKHMVQRLYAVLCRGDARTLVPDCRGAWRSFQVTRIYSFTRRQAIFSFLRRHLAFSRPHANGGC